MLGTLASGTPSGAYFQFASSSCYTEGVPGVVNGLTYEGTIISLFLFFLLALLGYWFLWNWLRGLKVHG